MTPLEAAWQQKLAALRAYVATHGRLPLQRDPWGLGDWVRNQRQGKKALDMNKTGRFLCSMTPARAAALEAVPGWAWEVDAEADWQEKLAAHGRLPPQGDATAAARGSAASVTPRRRWMQGGSARPA
jgi:hypothetical protein